MSFLLLFSKLPFYVKSTRTLNPFPVHSYDSFLSLLEHQIIQSFIHYFYLKCSFSFLWIPALVMIWNFFLLQILLDIRMIYIVLIAYLFPLFFHIPLIFTWMFSQFFTNRFKDDKRWSSHIIQIRWLQFLKCFIEMFQSVFLTCTSNDVFDFFQLFE